MANAGAIFAGIGQDLVTGTALSAPYGTPLPPTDATFFEATLDAAYKDAGYIGEAGVTIQQGRGFFDVTDMDGSVIDSIQNSSNGMLKTNFLELNEQTLRNLFGPDNVTVTNATASAGRRHAVVVALQEDLDPASHVFRMKSGRKRAGIVLPKGRITEVGDLAFTSSGAASVDVSIKTIPTFDDTLGKQVDFYLILDDGQWAISLVPVITSAGPAGQAEGEAVAVEGSRFTGATAVTFNDIAATSFDIVDDGLIVAVVPAGSAGSAPIKVTNASGVSVPHAYTRGA